MRSERRQKLRKILTWAGLHIFIDLFLAELVLLGIGISRLPFDRQIITLPRQEVASINVTTEYNVYYLRGDDIEEFNRCYDALVALRAPLERHSSRYRILGGKPLTIALMLQDGTETVVLQAVQNNPVICVETARGEVRYYHVGKESVRTLFETVQDLG